MVPSDLASKPDNLQPCVIKLSTEDLHVCSASDVAMPKPVKELQWNKLQRLNFVRLKSS